MCLCWNEFYILIFPTGEKNYNPNFLLRLFQKYENVQVSSYYEKLK